MIFDYVPPALQRLRSTGFALVVVTNQTAVARGLMTEEQVEMTHRRLEDTLRASGAEIDRVYFCPHHPHADVEAYRALCECRKPRPGMILKAAEDLDIDLASSYMVGDRVSDVVAGQKAGCRTILVQTGKSNAPPIISPESIPENVKPDHICSDLEQAVTFILAESASRTEAA